MTIITSMTRGLLFAIMFLTSCRSTTLTTEDLSIEENEFFCNGTKYMITYLKQSQEIKSQYGEFLHNKGQIRLKIDYEVFKGLPFGFISQFGVDSLDTAMVKKLNYNCPNPSDSNPDFEVSFYFMPRKRILSAIVMTILDKPGYRSGYLFETKLDDSGQLGQVGVVTIQE